jgi:flavin reductase (DIM6/NTAB) family NADH-FMN oxidoreductase RutF
VEKNPSFTLSFFADQYRQALAVCGAKSGRDTDKVAEAGLTPFILESGNVTFSQASLVLECRKLYSDFIKPDSFIDTSIIPHCYQNADFHKFYIGEITGAWTAQ